MTVTEPRSRLTTTSRESSGLSAIAEPRVGPGAGLSQPMGGEPPLPVDDELVAPPAPPVPVVAVVLVMVPVPVVPVVADELTPPPPVPVVLLDEPPGPVASPPPQPAAGMAPLNSSVAPNAIQYT